MGFTGSKKLNGSWRVSLWVRVCQTPNPPPHSRRQSASADMIFSMSGSKRGEITGRKLEM